MLKFKYLCEFQIANGNVFAVSQTMQKYGRINHLLILKTILDFIVMTHGGH